MTIVPDSLLIQLTPELTGARRLYRRASGWTTGCAATAQKSALVIRRQKGKK